MPRAPLLSALWLLVGNLIPVWAVWRGHMSVGDVFIVYWLENVAVWAITIAKIRTARGPGAPTRVSLKINGRRVNPSDSGALSSFFAMHYGLFTGVHGVFAFIIAGMAGGDLRPVTWGLVGLALVASHVGSFWLNWLGEGERDRVSPSRVMWQPYPRMIVLHVAILVAAPFALDSTLGDATGGLTPVLILFGLKTVVDLGLHVRERSRLRPV